MSDDICLTPSEAEGLRALLVFLALFEERAYDPVHHLYELTPETWQEMTAEAKSKLARFSKRAIASPR